VAPPAATIKPRKTVEALLTLIILILIGFALDVALVSKSQTQDLKTSQIKSCISGSVRSAEQMNIDWDIYLADLGRAKESGSSGRIAAREAAAIKADTVIYAQHHIDISVARLLPHYLAVVVLKGDYSCALFYSHDASEASR
jgi:hypothetical protein